MVVVVVVEARATLTPHFSLQTAAPVPARRRLRGAAALAAPLKVQLITGAPQDATPVPWCTLRRAKGDGVKRATAALALARAPPPRPRLPPRTGLRTDEVTGLTINLPVVVWDDAAAAAALNRRAARSRGPRRVAPIPAVEVAHAGVAYNPDPEAHQEALAAAVATETAKQAAREALMASAPPRYVSAGRRAASELDMLLVDGAESSESEGEDAGDGATPASRPSERKTTAARNRAARVRALDDTVAARRAAKRQAADIARVKAVGTSLDADAVASAARVARRAADAADRARRLPPKLGRGTFIEPPSAVLCTDEVPSSLRLLRPDAGLARDRFSSLQKRGLLEPRMPAAKRAGKRVKYEPEGRADAAAERQAGVDKLRAANKGGRKRAKKGGAVEE